MNKTAVIFCGGDYVSAERLSFVENPYIICADGGYDNALKAGFTPDIIIGDFDSVCAEIPKNIPILKLPVRKDATDTQVCVDYLIEQGYTKAYMICAVGGRIDHTMANTSLLAYGIRRNTEITIIGEDFHMFPIVGKKFLNGNPGEIFSVFPYGGNCTGVTEKGFEYTLNGETLFFDTPLGISNVFEKNIASVEVESGILIAVHYK